MIQKIFGISLVVLWLRLHASTAGGSGLILSQEAKMPYTIAQPHTFKEILCIWVSPFPGLCQSLTFHAYIHSAYWITPISLLTYFLINPYWITPISLLTTVPWQSSG